jgi:hypothetical protein
MYIDIPDDLHRRLEQLAKGTGQDVGTLVCEAIEQRLALAERKNRLPESPAWQLFSGQDPLVSLIGFGEDDAADVSQKKYDYLGRRVPSMTGSLWTRGASRLYSTAEMPFIVTRRACSVGRNGNTGSCSPRISSSPNPMP